MILSVKQFFSCSDRRPFLLGVQRLSRSVRSSASQSSGISSTPAGLAWGAAYGREDSMHFEVSKETIKTWIAEGKI
jgi:hypothetical protein